jgi:hypothetical protein
LIKTLEEFDLALDEQGNVLVTQPLLHQHLPGRE